MLCTLEHVAFLMHFQLTVCCRAAYNKTTKHQKLHVLLFIINIYEQNYSQLKHTSRTQQDSYFSLTLVLSQFIFIFPQFLNRIFSQRFAFVLKRQRKCMNEKTTINWQLNKNDHCAKSWNKLTIFTLFRNKMLKKRHS